MKNFTLNILIGCLLAIFTPNFAKAQLNLGNPPPPWAAGQISLEFVGDEENSCDDKETPYTITLQHYRDYTSTNLPWPNAIDVVVRSRDLDIEEIVTLSVKREMGQISQYCLNGNPVATEGAWYSNRNPFNFKRAEDWEILTYGEIRSTEYLNILPGQTFSIKTTLNNKPCGSVEFEGKTYVNKAPTSTPYYIQPHPVISFCSGINKRYDYGFPVEDVDGDRITFRLSPATNIELGALHYEGLFSGQIPFPSSSFISLAENGVLSFTPSIRFSALAAVQVVETRPYYRLRTVNNETVLDQSSVVVSITQREMRVIFDNNCNKRLPEFEGVEKRIDKQSGQTVYDSRYNALEDAYEFDCATTEMIFNLSEPMFCNTLDKNDFRIALTYDNIDSVINAIDAVTATNCINNEFDQIIINLHDPIGPGRYNLFFKYGSNDSTTILNKCDFSLPINEPWAKIYVNTNFTYDHPKDEYVYCDPADEIPIAKAVKPGGNLKPPARVFYTWKKQPQNPRSEADTVFAEDAIIIDGERGSEWEVYADDDPYSDQTDEIWEIGVGFDYSIYDPFTGDTLNKKICYDTDRFRVIRYKNPPVEIPDYDLCPEDDWPTVDLDSMVQLYNAKVDDFVWKSFMQFPKDFLPADDLAHDSLWSITRAGYSTFTTPGAMTNRFNYFASLVPLEINGHICYEKDTFIVIKEDAKANIGNDTLICPGEQFVLRNNYDYLFPDSMSYRWFIDDNLIADNTSDTIMITVSGFYKLEVTKRTIVNSVCIGYDSVKIEIADSLYAPLVHCLSVTFKDGVVQQKFGATMVEGASGYEIRSIDPNSGRVSEWMKVTGDWGMHHTLKGAQLQAQFRAVNYKVPEDAPCRYGPISDTAKACEIEVKPINVFTPNGDGINDFLDFDLLELFPGSKLQVYNRYGKLIYEDNDYYNDWDGGKHPAGTYFYILEVNDPENRHGVYKGNFTIIRD